MNTRTVKQNAAEHRWFRDIATTLNEAGYSVNDRIIIKMDIPFTEEIIKKQMFAKITGAMFGEVRTSKLTTVQTSEAIEVMNRLLADNWSIHVPFPERTE